MHNLVFDAFLLILILVGNISVLLVIINDGQKSRMNVYIQNLAVAGNMIYLNNSIKTRLNTFSRTDYFLSIN